MEYRNLHSSGKHQNSNEPLTVWVGGLFHCSLGLNNLASYSIFRAMIHEKQFQAILCKYPELIEEGLTLIGSEIAMYGRRIDILYQDKFARHLLVELKIGPIKDEHIGQIMAYEGMLLSHENPTIRIMLIGNRVPPNMQRSLDYHGIAWREITLSQLKGFLEKKDDQDFLHYFDDELDIPLKIPKQMKKKVSKPTFLIPVTQNPQNVDSLVMKLKSSSNYQSFKSILPIKRQNEARAKEMLVKNIANLTGEQLKEVLTLIDEPYQCFDENGRINHRPWFGKLIKLNARNLEDEKTEDIRKWLKILTNNQIPVDKRIDTLRKPDVKIKGFDVGLITMMLYILDKPNYLIWFEPTHSGLFRINTEIGPFEKKGSNYLRFNQIGKSFAEKYGFEHTELDWIFSVGILPHL